MHQSCGYSSIGVQVIGHKSLPLGSLLGFRVDIAPKAVSSGQPQAISDPLVRMESHLSRTLHACEGQGLTTSKANSAESAVHGPSISNRRRSMSRYDPGVSEPY